MRSRRRSKRTWTITRARAIAARRSRLPRRSTRSIARTWQWWFCSGRQDQARAAGRLRGFESGERAAPGYGSQRAKMKKLMVTAVLAAAIFAAPPDPVAWKLEEAPRS